MSEDSSGEKERYVKGGDGDLSLLENISVFLENHDRKFKVILCATALCGTVLIVKALKPFKSFHTVKDIPVEFVSHKITLYGKLVTVSNDGILNIQHKPPIPLSMKRKNPPCGEHLMEKVYVKDDLLPVKLAYLTMVPHGIQYLQKLGATHPPVAFTILNKRLHGLEEQLICLVKILPIHWWKREVLLNKFLLIHGLAKLDVQAANQTDASGQTGSKTKQFKELLQAEELAKKKSVGVWRDVRSPSIVWRSAFKVRCFAKNMYSYLTKVVRKISRN